MIIFPAIDLKDGNCVRLKQGDMDKATIFNHNPTKQAQYFLESGFKWLHIVDLNGAVTGQPVNSKAIMDISKNVSINIQLGGGIRNIEAIDFWLSQGIKKVILGTVALTNPELVKQACTKYPEQIIIGIDAKAGKVATDGWTKTGNVTTIELAKRFENIGVNAIIYTDIERDGVLTGPNIAATQELARSISIPIIASGGVSNYEDIAQISALQADGVIGVICGRALYEGNLEPKILQQQRWLES